MVIQTLCKNPDVRGIYSSKTVFADLNTTLRFTIFFVDETLSHEELVSNLTMRGSTMGTVLYSCTATNMAGTSEQKTCQVTVIRKGDVCILML